MEYRKAKVNCYCRGCDKMLKKDQDFGVFMYSHRNRGQNIVICENCIEKMWDLLKVHS